MTSMPMGENDSRKNNDTHGWYTTPFGIRYLPHGEAFSIAVEHAGKGVAPVDGPSGRPVKSSTAPTETK